jgi:hypothetical protein
MGKEQWFAMISSFYFWKYSRIYDVHASWSIKRFLKHNMADNQREVTHNPLPLSLRQRTKEAHKLNSDLKNLYNLLANKMISFALWQLLLRALADHSRLYNN